MKFSFIKTCGGLVHVRLHHMEFSILHYSWGTDFGKREKMTLHLYDFKFESSWDPGPFQNHGKW